MSQEFIINGYPFTMRIHKTSCPYYRDEPKDKYADDRDYGEDLIYLSCKQLNVSFTADIQCSTRKETNQLHENLKYAKANNKITVSNDDLSDSMKLMAQFGELAGKPVVYEVMLRLDIRPYFSYKDIVELDLLRKENSALKKEIAALKNA